MTGNEQSKLGVACKQAVAAITAFCLAALGLFFFPATQAAATTGVTTPTSPVTLTLSSPGDTNGLFYYLGTHGNTAAWQNPAYNGEMMVYDSSQYVDGNGLVYGTNKLTDRTDALANAFNDPNGWFSWDLGPSRQMNVTTYTLKGRSDANSQMPQTWAVQGSNDNFSWTTIDQQTNHALAQGQWSTFSIPSNSNAFRYLRIVQNGLNNSGANWFVLNEAEFYGTLSPVSSQSTTTTTSDVCGATTTTTTVAPSGTVTSLNLSAAGDQNGLFYYLGTNGHTTAWQNPAYNGQMMVYDSSQYVDGNGLVYGTNKLTDRTDALANAFNDPNGWFSWDLGPSRQMNVTSYTLKGRSDANSQMPQTWAVQGSNDNYSWTTIDQETNHALAQGQWSTFSIPSNSNAFRYLRIVQNGLNNSGANWFVLNEAEFYGNLHSGTAAPTTAYPSSSPVSFSLSSAGDQNGLFYYLGTNGHTTAWQNPAYNGQLIVNDSSQYVDGNGLVYGTNKLTDRTDALANAFNDPNGWFSWDLGPARQMNVTTYTLKGRSDANSQMPQTWAVQGSNDNFSWTTIDQETNHVLAQGQWSTFNVPSSSNGYRYLRIVQNGLNNSGANWFVLNEAEFYGTLSPVSSSDSSSTTTTTAPCPTTTTTTAAPTTTTTVASTTTTTVPVVAQDTSLSVANATAMYGDSSINLSADVTSTGGSVTEGNVRFQLSQNGVNVGSPQAGAVDIGHVRLAYILPQGTGAGTYTINATFSPTTDFNGSSATAVATIAVVPLTITANDARRAYGTANPNFTAAFTGLVGGDTASSLNGTLSLTTTADQNSGAGVYPIHVSGVSSPNYSITFVDGTLVVGKTDLTVTANDATASYGSTLPDLSVSYSGFVNGEGPADLTGSALIATTATSDSGAGTYPITVSGLSSDNYNIHFVDGTLTVVPAQLTISVNDSSKVYGSNNPAFSVSYNGFVNNESPANLIGSLVFSTTADASSHVGNYAVSASGLSSPNYNITFVDGNLSVVAANLTVSVNDTSKIYGSDNPAFSVNYNGFVNGDGPANLDGTLVFSTVANANSHVGMYDVFASGLSSNDYNVSFISGTLTITPASLTVTVDNATKLYGQPNPDFTAEYSGLVNGDTAAVLGTPVFSTSADGASGVGTYPVSVSGFNDGDYTITTVDGTLTITPASLTVTADNAQRLYGEANPDFTASFTGFVNGDDPSVLSAPVTISTTATQTSPTGTYAIVPAGATDPNYNITFVNGSLTVGVATVTVTVNDSTKVYGSDNPQFSLSVSGLMNGDDASVLGTPVYTTDANASSPVGSYSVHVGGLSSTNYAINFVDGTLAVTPAALTVTANDASSVYGSALPVFTASYSGFVNGDDASALSTPAVVSTSATSSSPVGTYVLNVAGATDPNYNISFVPGTLTITPAALTVTANDTSSVYGSALPVFTASYNGFVNGDGPATLSGVAAFTTTAVVDSPVGTYPIHVSGLSSPNYTINFADGTLSITQATLTVTANNATAVYGHGIPALTASYSGFVNGDSVASLAQSASVSTTASGNSNVGTYPINASAVVSPNYTVVYVPGELVITPETLTITANNATKIYGDANPVFSASYSGFVNGDSPSSLRGSLVFSTDATVSSPVGSYAIVPSGVFSGNYTITFVNGTLAVTPAALTVTANDTTMNYGSPLPTLTAAYTGFVNGDTSSALNGTLALTTSASSMSPAGNYPIVPSGVTSPNYNITFVNGTLTIKQAILTVTVNPSSKTYGSVNPAFSVSYSGFAGNEGPSNLGGSLIFATDATASSPVGLYGVQASGLTSNNYVILYTGGNLTINPAALTVTADNVSIVYGSALPALTASYSGFVNGDTAASLNVTPVLSTSGTTVGSYPINVSGVSLSNYNVTYVNGTLTITPAALTITADNQTRPYGTANPTLTASAAGFVNGDTWASLQGTLTLSTTATTSSPAGTYPITVSGVSSPNYNITFVNGTLTVTSVVQNCQGDDHGRGKDKGNHYGECDNNNDDDFGQGGRTYHWNFDGRWTNNFGWTIKRQQVSCITGAPIGGLQSVAYNTPGAAGGQYKVNADMHDVKANTCWRLVITTSSSHTPFETAPFKINGNGNSDKNSNGHNDFGRDRD